MNTFIGSTWYVIKGCNAVSIVMMFFAVGLFGWHLARTAASETGPQHGLSPMMWHGARPRLALQIFCASFALQALSILLAILIPTRG